MMHPTDLCGVFFDMPADQYHRLPGASPSRLKLFDGVTAAEARVALEEPWKGSVYSKIGTLVHAQYLEPLKDLPKVKAYPEKYPDENGKDWHMGAKFCKDWVAEWEGQGYTTLPMNPTKDTPGYSDVKGIVESLLSKDSLNRYLQGARTEVSVIDWSETWEMIVRSRLDMVPIGPDLVDLKVTTQQDDFETHAIAKGYHIQAGMNLDLWNSQCGEDEPKTGYVYFTVKPTRPYSVRRFRATPEYLAAGRKAWVKLAARYAECLRTGNWPDYPDVEVPLGLPRWFKGV